MNPLKQLSEQCGQSPWLDYVRRDLIEKGELATLIERDGVRGVTSNPSIFEKAIAGSEQYGEALKAFQQSGDHSISAIYEHLAIADIRAAADVLRPVWEATKHADGFISLECSPYLANATEATIEEALRLWKVVDRPNLMVKVPGTEAGIPAIRTLIGKGLNINVTLLFAVGMYEQVAEAYIAGLEDFAKSGGDVSKVASVASFFVSRIDSNIDKRLDKLGDKSVAGKLRGKVAIANAKVAYRSYQRLFAGARWEALAAKGAKTQRLLWASTSTKDPKLPDTLYVEELIGKDTVNTMPPATMDAFREHGKIHRDAVEHGLAEAEATMRALADAGISMKEVTDELVAEGVQQFADAFDQLLGAVAARRRTIFSGDKPDITIKAGDAAIEKAIAAETEKWRHDGLIRRLWEGDKTLWTGTDEDQWLGWLTIVGEELKGIGELERFQQEVKSGGSSDVVLLGMGGSSLGPEVLAETFGRQAGFPEFHMLDSTDPAQIKALEGAIDLGRSLFIVSSKSGSTLEPNIYMAYFFQQVANKVGKDKAAKHFVAVTDPGSSLDKHAQATGFAHVFYGVKSIGGRYSVLSKFGLVPAAAIGLDLRKLLATTQQMVRACGDDVPPAENPGVKLGIAMGVAARDFRRDKVTIIASPGIHDLGAWLEQLLAESTGKQGHGLIPVDSEPLASPDKYGRDRFFAYLALDGKEDPKQRAAVEALEKAGHPVARMVLPDVWHVGQEFFRWEIATAVAGAVIGIDAFNQPDVEASKIATRELTVQYEKDGKLPDEQPVFRANGVAIFADAKNAKALGQQNTLSGYLKSHLGRAHAGDYVALLAYMHRDRPHIEALQAMRTEIRDATKDATCVGFGPRFLHSTGQAYKGGPNSGVFVQITCDDPADIPVPDAKYTFGIVKAAQARGDLQVLEERDRRALRVHLKDVSTGLKELARAVTEALG